LKILRWSKITSQIHGKRTTGIVLGVWAVCLTVSAKAVIDTTLGAALEDAPAHKEFRVVVRLKDTTDLKSNRANRISHAELIRGRRANAAASQGRLDAFFREHAVKKISPLWLINGLALTADAKTIQKLARHPAVNSLSLNQTFSLSPPSYSSNAPPAWNLLQINAPALWSLGFTGFGIVVGVMDTGADLANPHLLPSYRGGSNSWFDPFGTYSTPYDGIGHGTQVLGIILGANDIDTPIGIAPSAKWIAARIFTNAGVGDVENTHRAFEWMLDPDGDPNTPDAPHIVNCSWGLTEYVNQCQNEFQEDVSYLRQAGMGVIFAAGNESVNPSYPSSVSPANYPESLSVGAVDSASVITPTSSRGPSACDGLIYPTLVAPGSSIETCDLSFGGLVDQHVYVDGTSFAAPHVTGAMALVLSAFPELNMRQIEDIFIHSAVDLGMPDPDNGYGYGLINAVQAYKLAVSLLSGDFDLSCEVNISDVIILANEWLNCERFDCVSDINADGNVNFLDFAALANHFNNDSCLLSPDF
jgi:bacillopeptidase F